MKLTERETASSDTCQLRFQAPTQPFGCLADGNCSALLCVEVTERYSLGQLLVGNFVFKYPTSSGVLDEEET